jgi:hypothetical protein
MDYAIQVARVRQDVYASSQWQASRRQLSTNGELWQVNAEGKGPHN